MQEIRKIEKYGFGKKENKFDLPLFYLHCVVKKIPFIFQLLRAQVPLQVQIFGGGERMCYFVLNFLSDYSVTLILIQYNALQCKTA